MNLLEVNGRAGGSRLTLAPLVRGADGPAVRPYLAGRTAQRAIGFMGRKGTPARKAQKTTRIDNEITVNSRIFGLG